MTLGGGADLPHVQMRPYYRINIDNIFTNDNV